MSFVTDMDEIVDSVSDWASELVDDIVMALSPDGKPFQERKMSKQEQVAEYLQIRGDPAQWQLWIDARAQAIVNHFMAEGLDPSTLESIHPYDIAISYAIDYSAKMENMLLRENS